MKCEGIFLMIQAFGLKCSDKDFDKKKINVETEEL